MLTELLSKAFDIASQLSPTEQDHLAQWILLELESERRWEKLFAKSQDILAELADEALREYQQGEILSSI